MSKRSLRNPTIRFREIGHFQMRSKNNIDSVGVQLVRRDYEASDGTEIFLSFENSNLDIIFGFLRLRVPSSDAHRPEISSKPSTILRELRVYGPVVDLGERDSDAWQHLGLGEKLINAANNISRDEFNAKQIVVNSGIGVKEYYRNLGFEDSGPYLFKKLTS
jgi:elongator complex protein 3